ncbi:MAG TPA: GIY-YIG nuclease family protein [Fodinibius sp.]|nr:GIY-YIG nuclease family protein [Fodinibius sp.]
MTKRSGYIYILSNKVRTVLYIGVTADLIRRVYNHRMGEGSTFSCKYKTKYLLYYETYNSILPAIEREEQLKNWKLELIKKVNPNLRDIWPEVVGDFRK